MRVSSPQILSKNATKTKGKTALESSESWDGRRIHPDRPFGYRNLGLNTDTDSEQCSVCTGKFKGKQGLKIHQTKKGCGKLLNSHRKTIKDGCKSEATSTQDTNHSDARCRMNQETTLKGNGSQSMEAMDKFTEWELKKEKKCQESRVGRKERGGPRECF